MDARIILAGQPVDLVGAMRQGNAAAIETNALRQNNQLTDLYRQQGAGLLAGDQGAMNALAGVDPGLAMGMKANQQTYAQNTRKMEILNAGERRVIEDRAASMTAAERAAAAAEIEDAVKMGMGIPDAATWDQMMGQVAPEMVGQFGNRQALAMKYMSVAEAFKIANPEPVKPADDYERYAARETAAGRVPLDDISFAQALKGKGASITTTNADGSTTTVSMGGGAKDPSNPTVGDVYNPAAASDAIGLIDNILGVDGSGEITPESRAVIERITGAFEGGGGNNIDDMSGIRRAWYGEKGVDKIEKLGQLQSKAWLAARDMLKGGGAITDYESRKAENAVARLSRAKGPEEFISALTELKDAIADGKAKLDAAQAGAVQPGASTIPAPPAPPVGSDEDLMNQLLGGGN